MKRREEKGTRMGGAFDSLRERRGSSIGALRRRLLRLTVYSRVPRLAIDPHPPPTAFEGYIGCCSRRCQALCRRRLIRDTSSTLNHQLQLAKQDSTQFLSPLRAKSQSCPFCWDSLNRMNSGELWIYTSNCDITDLSSIAKENLKRLVVYIEKLPLVVPNPMVVSYDPHS